MKNIQVNLPATQLEVVNAVKLAGFPIETVLITSIEDGKNTYVIGHCGRIFELIRQLIKMGILD